MTEPRPERKSLLEALQSAAVTQIVRTLIDSFRVPVWGHPTKNSFPRFLAATSGAFFPFFVAIPIFLYLGAPSVFAAFVEWIRTIPINIHIALVILGIYFSTIAVVAIVFGLIVSHSVSDDNTLAEMTFHGFKYAFNIAIRICLVLTLFMLFRYSLTKWMT